MEASMNHTVYTFDDYPEVSPLIPECKTIDTWKVVDWKPTQQVRLQHPAKCTACGDRSQDVIGLISVMHRRKGPHGKTWWYNRCPEHYARAVRRGTV
jgi:hypothetical protein